MPDLMRSLPDSPRWWRAGLVAGSVAALALGAGGFHFYQTAQLHQAEQRALAASSAEGHARLLGHHFEHAFSAISLLAGMLRQYGEIRDFDDVAEELVRNYGLIGALQLAPQGIVSRVYPREGEQQAIGHNLLADPGRRDDALAAIQSRRLTVTPLVKLIQGGEGFIGRLPVFVPDRTGAERFWGFTIVLIRIPNMKAAANLDELPRQGYDYELTYRPRHSLEAAMAAKSGAAPLADPVRSTTPLSNGDSITLYAAPRGGWPAAPRQREQFALLVIAASLLAALVYYLMRWPEALRREVGVRTQALSIANASLAGEIAEHRKTQQALRDSSDFADSVVENIPDMVFVKDAKELRFVRFNRAAEDLLGYPRTEMIGKSDYDLFPKTQADFFTAKDREVLAGGILADIPTEEIDTRTQGRRLLHTQKIPIFDKGGEPLYLLGISEDVTERIHAERQIIRLNRTYAVLSGVNEAIIGIKDRQELLQRVCRILVEIGGLDFVCIFLADGDRGPFQMAASAGNDRGLLAHWRHPPLVAGPALCVGRPDLARRVVCRQGDVDSETGCRAAIDFGFHSCTGLPLKIDDRESGRLALFSDDPDRFDDAEFDLLERLARGLSHALEALAQDALRREAEEHLRLASRVFDNSTEGIIITDAGNNILMVNKMFTTITQYGPEEVMGKNPRMLSSGKQDASFYRTMWESLQEIGEWHGEIHNRRKDGQFYPEWLTVSAVKDKFGVVTNYVAVFSDLTARKEIEERINFLAYYDALTGLPNRQLFVDRLRQALAQAERSHGSAGVVFLDFDRFSMINETFGHAVGDQLLKEAARRLQRSVRHSDSVARIGSDEFTVILPNLEDPHDAARVAQKILDVIAEPMPFMDHEVFISASIGIAVFPSDGRDAEALIQNAEIAMYRAMRDGGGCYRFYTPDMNASSFQRITLESKLHHALDRGELTLCYQPLVEARSMSIVGAEALLRWSRPHDGVIEPNVFVPLLEENGLIVPVGEWVLRTACGHNREWREAGQAGLFVAVNFSAQQFHEPRLAKTIQRVVRDAGGDPRFLEIELTERAMMHNAEETIKELRRLKAIGARVSIDDFGTGYSSLSYLKRFPIDTLKIDMSFVHDALHSPDASAIVKAIIAMSRALKLTTIAEGVETWEQAEFLRTQGCDLLQGYYFGRPMPHDEFLQVLHAGAILKNLSECQS